MTTWNDYKPSWDAAYGTLDPATQGLVQLAISQDYTGNKDASLASWNTAIAALKKAGFNDQQAAVFLGTGNNIVRWPNGNPEELVYADNSAAPYAALGVPKADFTPDVFSGLIDPIVKGKEDGSKVDQLTARINQFAQSLLGPVSPNDPTMQMIVRNASDAAQRASGQAGLRQSSGATGYGAATAAAGLGQQYDMQRKGLASQALSLANNRDLGLGNLQLGYDNLGLQRDQLNNQLQSQIAANRAAQQQQALQAVGGTLGTVAGAYFGMPGLGQAGASLFGGLTQMPTPNYRPYTTQGYGGINGSGNRGGMGGSGGLGGGGF